MLRDEYKKEIDALKFSEDLEERIIAASHASKPAKRRTLTFAFVPAGIAAALVIAVAVLLSFRLADFKTSSDQSMTESVAYDTNTVGVTAFGAEEKEERIVSFAYTADSCDSFYSSDRSGYMLLLLRDGALLSADECRDICDMLAAEYYDVTLSAFADGSPFITICLSEDEYTSLLGYEEFGSQILLIKE